jgi:hypothetical protein
MNKLQTKISSLSNKDLIRLSNELRQTVLPEDALIRKVIKDTEADTIAPMIAFVSVGQTLSFVLADRLEIALDLLEN